MAKGKQRRPRTADPSPPDRERAAPHPASSGSEQVEHDGASRTIFVGVVLLVAIIGLGTLFAVRGGGEEADVAGGDPPAVLRVPWLDPDGQLPIVGSVDVNPADDALWLSTNTGLFRLAGPGGRPRRVVGRLSTSLGEGTISEELVIRFRGPDELYASGHPPDDSPLPDSLGLIESRDAGKTWSSVSETGSADFHAIQLAGRVLVAGRYGEPKIDVSRDGGRTFQTRAPPQAVTDLEVDPDAPQRWVASTPAGLYVSSNEGRSWVQRDPTPHSYFAWPRGDTLYRADPDGPILRSGDGGRSWQRRGSVGSQPQALAADGADRLFAVLLDGRIRESRDGGTSWRDLAGV